MRYLIPVLLLLATPLHADPMCRNDSCEGHAKELLHKARIMDNSYVRWYIDPDLAGTYIVNTCDMDASGNWIRLYHTHKNFKTLYPRIEQAIALNEYIRIWLTGDCRINFIDVTPTQEPGAPEPGTAGGTVEPGECGDPWEPPCYQ